MTDRSQWLDPEEFPFTEAELQAALKGWERVPGLDHLAGEIARGLRECRVAREEAQRALATGSRDLDVINYPIAMFPDEVWALIADLSPAHLARVESFFGARRAKQRQRRVANAMIANGLNPRDTPPTAILEQLDAEDLQAEAQWLEIRARVRTPRPGSGEGVT